MLQREGRPKFFGEDKTVRGEAQTEKREEYDFVARHSCRAQKMKETVLDRAAKPFNPNLKIEWRACAIDERKIVLARHNREGSIAPGAHSWRAPFLRVIQNIF